MNKVNLGDICRLRTESGRFDPTTYVSTESMLPNKAGIVSPSSFPEIDKARVFHEGDTLVSNIRPYYKKIWQAEYDGCCSNDVLVFQPLNCDADYLYWLLSSDAFFNYVMATSKGTKMPRGDKYAIMHYSFERMGIEQQKSVAEVLNPIRKLMRLNQQENDYLAA